MFMDHGSLVCAVAHDLLRYVHCMDSTQYMGNDGVNVYIVNQFRNTLRINLGSADGIRTAILDLVNSFSTEIGFLTTHLPTTY